MPSLQIRFLLFLPAFLFLVSCNNNNEESLLQKITRQWEVSRSQVTGNNTVGQDGNQGYLTLAVDNNINLFVFKSGPDSSAGTWSLSDSTLILEYNPAPSEQVVDSISLATSGESQRLKLFQHNNELGSIGADGIEVPHRQQKFRITDISSTALVLQEGSTTLVFSYTSKMIEGSVSVGSLGRGMLGLVVMILILYAFSSNRKGIQWKLVATGLAFQLIIAIGVLKVDLIKDIFEMFGQFFVVILSFTMEGSRFVMGDLVNPSSSIGFIFAFQILPTIIFFSALTSLLFYLGILQKIVYGLAWVMSKTMKLSGAESLAAAANVFLGQTEAPLMVKPYIAGMTRSELLCLMTGGMATIAGGVMAAYIGFLGGDDPAARLFFAKHLLAASVMSAPAAVVAAKILLPQTQDIEEKLVISKEKIGKNLLEAISIGTTEGLKLAVNVGAMLLVFIAMIAMLNFFLKDFIGSYTGLNDQIISLTGGRYDGLTMQFLLGYLCAPLSWLMGVCKEDMVLVGQLLGEKTILNEFVAYTTLGKMQVSEMFREEKSIIIATYILCGFANFASIGIQIGGIGSLAPEKRTALSELGFRALLGGTMASLLTAVIVGMLI